MDSDKPQPDTLKGSVREREAGPGDKGGEERRKAKQEPVENKPEEEAREVDQ